MLSRIREKYKENGIQGIVLALISRFPGVRAVCVYYVYRLPFDKLMRNELPIEQLRVVLAEDWSIDDLSKIQNKPVTFRERFQMGHHCYMAYMENEPVSYLWWHFGTYHVEQRYGFQIPLKSSQIYYYDSYTKPDKRKLGLTRKLLTAIANHRFIDCGKNEILAIIETSNLGSIKAHNKIGFEKESLRIYIDINGFKKNVVLHNYR